MLRVRTLALFFSLTTALGCAPPPTGPVAPVVAPPPEAPSPSATVQPAPTNEAPVAVEDFDPVALGMTEVGVTKLCDDKLAEAEAALESIRSLAGGPPEKLTYEATLGRFDQAMLAVNSAAEFPYLMGVAHPEPAVREAAKRCEPKTDAFTTSMWLDAKLAGVLKAFGAKGEKLDGERARLLSDVLRDFRRNGLDLAPDKQDTLRKWNAEITKLGQDFMSNIASSQASIEVRPTSLEGLPKEYVASHAVQANGRVKITTDYPDYFPFITYSRDRRAAQDLFALFMNRGGDQNVRLLEQILRLRSEKAKLLGYASWADYAIEPRMAKSSKNVRDFLEKVRVALNEASKAEMRDLMAEYVVLGLGKKTDKLPQSERYFLEDRVRERKFKFNSQELSDYFEVTAVRKGLMDITARMYGLEYREVPARAWHPDVTAYEVWSQGKLIGKFYLDLYARPDKYKHAAMFGVRTAARLPDGRWQTPIAALECNFPKPGPEAALMSHESVVTFFHEFGHVLHDILTQSELATYSGTATVRDFVEAPSQMFEEWAWSREVLDLFAKHHKTGAKIPDALFDSMTKSRSFGRALATQRQLFLATLDLELHAREPGFDTTRVLQEVQDSVDSFKYLKGTHFQSSFGHLIGYDAAYYGYQWALSLSRDVLTRFRAEGLLNTEVAASWRTEVLSKGGGTDERTMITRFLGREPSHDAYIEYLQGKN